MAVKSRCTRCKKTIYIPKYVEGDYSFCIGCQLKKIEEALFKHQLEEI